MPTEAEKKYKAALERLRTKIDGMDGSPKLFSDNPKVNSRKKRAILDFIQAIEKAQSEEKVSFKRLTIALNNTSDLLGGKLNPEQYNRAADSMLSPSNQKGVIGICGHYFSWMMFFSSVAILFAGSMLFGLLGLVSSYFVQDLGNYLDNKRSKQEDSISPLADDMKTLLRVWIDASQVQQASTRPIVKSQSLPEL